MRSALDLNIPPSRYLLFDASDIPGYEDYHMPTAAASDQEPGWVDMDADDPYNIMYTSGTTGAP